MKYHHRQFNFLALGLFIAGYFITLLVTLFPETIFSEFKFFEEFYQASIKGWEYYAIAISSAIVLLGLNFASMVIELNNEQVRWFYGIGIPVKNIQFNQIKSTSVIRTKWWQGWGIRRLGRGWMYNVFGLNAIEIVEMSGKVTVLGSNDVRTLQHRIEKARKVIAEKDGERHG